MAFDLPDAFGAMLQQGFVELGCCRHALDADVAVRPERGRGPLKGDRPTTQKV